MPLSQQEVLNRIFQPDATIRGFTLSVDYTPSFIVNREARSIVCKAAELDAGATDGVLVVHPVNNPAGSNYPMSLVAGAPAKGILFDEVIASGSTVDVSKVTLFPLLP